MTLAPDSWQVAFWRHVLATLTGSRQAVSSRRHRRQVSYEEAGPGPSNTLAPDSMCSLGDTNVRAALHNRQAGSQQERRASQCHMHKPARLARAPRPSMSLAPVSRCSLGDTHVRAALQSQQARHIQPWWQGPHPDIECCMLLHELYNLVLLQSFLLGAPWVTPSPCSAAHQAGR
jgi:hypothetical protein